VALKQYSWKAGFPKPAVDANEFGRVMEELDQGQGVKAADLVERARDPASPLHAAFLWDDDAAAERYRAAQARRYIGGLTVVRVHIENGPDLPARQFHSVRVTPDSQRSYVPREQVMGARELRVQLIATAKKELEGFLDRYAAILADSSFLPKLGEVLDLMKDEADQLAVDATRRRSPRGAAAGAEDDLHQHI